MTVLVLGATGKTGRRVVAELERRGASVRAASRSSPAFFEWRRPDSWQCVLEGARAAYVVDSQLPDSAKSLAAFVVAAGDAGISRLVLLSSRDAAVSGGVDWLASERAVQESPLEWTILRPTWFMQNFSEWEVLRNAVAAGVVPSVAGAGLEPFVDAADIAEVAAAALTEEGHAGETYEPSGPELLTFDDAVCAIGSATRTSVTVLRLRPGDYARRLRGEGVDDGTIEALLTLGRWIREGRNAHLSDGVQRALGREPRGFSAYAREAAQARRW